MKITHNLYCKLILSVFIGLVSRIANAEATEISSATYEISPIIGFGQENFYFQIADFDAVNKSRTVNFEPNIAGVTRLGVNAFGFGIGYSFRGTEKSNDSLKGNTSFADLQLNYHNKKWGIDTFYQTYTGFYTNNTQAIQYFPNLSFNHRAIMLRYALQDSDFSVNGIVDQADEINSDAGKLYALAGFHDHKMEADVSIMQMENAGIDLQIENLRKLQAKSLNIGLGYGYQWVYSNKLFIGVLADMISTMAKYDYETTTGSTSETNSTFSYNFKLAGGYAGGHHRTGLSLNGDVTTLKTNGRGNIKAAAGRILLYYRFVF